MSESSENNHVVVVDGQRASGTMSQHAAQQEKERRQRALAEKASGQPQPLVEVKQNLFG